MTTDPLTEGPDGSQGGHRPGSVELEPSDPVESARREVLAGLARDQKEISSKYFYDQRGSELFEEITRLPEYYPTRTERALLDAWAPVWVDELRPRALVELGAGSAEKSRLVIRAMEEARRGSLYVPVDVSGDFLQETAHRLRTEFPGLRVEPEVADISHPLRLSSALVAPAWVAFLGSTLGNFDSDHAVALLTRISRSLRSGDLFLLGVDLRPGPCKSVERLEAAYNDIQGITAAFNRNVLHVVNREFGADFKPEQYRHHAFYAAGEGRIEMHLVAESDQVVTFPGGAVVTVARGESIRTEISCKYDRAMIDELFGVSGLRVTRWQEDPEGLFALVMAESTDAERAG